VFAKDKKTRARAHCTINNACKGLDPAEIARMVKQAEDMKEEDDVYREKIELRTELQELAYSQEKSDDLLEWRNLSVHRHFVFFVVHLMFGEFYLLLLVVVRMSLNGGDQAGWFGPRCDTKEHPGKKNQGFARIVTVADHHGLFKS